MSNAITFGKCQKCKKDMNSEERYHCDKCGAEKCDMCVKITMIRQDENLPTYEMICSEKINSEKLCGNSLGFIHTNISLNKDNEIVFGDGIDLKKYKHKEKWDNNKT